VNVFDLLNSEVYMLAVDCCFRVIPVWKVKLVIQVRQVKMGWLVHLGCRDLQ